jgi:hypothetical protein
MRANNTKKLVFFIILLFFVSYLIWLFRASANVVWMDQIQFLAGNIDHLYSHKLTIQDFYYTPPFLQCISLLSAFLNCKLFSYNTQVETVLSGIFLLLVAVYFIRSQLGIFSAKVWPWFALISCLIIFGLHKWEMSLLGLGVGVFMIVFIIFVCIGTAHKYYFNQLKRPFFNRYFVLFYVGVSVLAIMEATSYFLPFLASMLVLLFVNYKLFRDKIDIKRWRTVLITTLSLIVFAIFINQLAGSYSQHHPYEGYAKGTVGNDMTQSIPLFFKEPLFVSKFYLTANTGNLLDNESYSMSSAGAAVFIPVLGLIVLALYAAVFVFYVRKKKSEHYFSINLILYTVLFYATVMLGRLKFHNVFAGTAPRYASATYAGILGLATICLALLTQKNNSIVKRVLYLLPALLIAGCYICTDRTQWTVAPYRKEAYMKMAANLIENKDLDVLQANSIAIAQKARQVLMDNHLNVFKQGGGLRSYTVTSEFNNVPHTGFYDLEGSGDKRWRWTNGNAELLLPNLHTDKKEINIRLFCTTVNADTPVVVVNNQLYPSAIRKFDSGFEYRIPVTAPGQTAISKVTIINKSFNPHLRDAASSDTRDLGLIFNSITFFE